MTLFLIANKYQTKFTNSILWQLSQHIAIVLAYISIIYNCLIVFYFIIAGIEIRIWWGAHNLNTPMALTISGRRTLTPQINRLLVG
jgi:hypothetical protein